MYNKGDLKLLDKPCKSCTKDVNGGFVCDAWDEGHVHSSRDNRGPGKVVNCPAAYLPHSCESWIIGGPKNIRALITDLENALAKIEGKPALSYAKEGPDENGPRVPGVEIPGEAAPKDETDSQK